MKRFMSVCAMLTLCAACAAVPIGDVWAEEALPYHAAKQPFALSERQAALLRQIDASETVDGICLTVTGLLFDGEVVVVDWTIENEKPEALALVRVDSVTIEGLPVEAHQDFPWNQWLPRAFGLDVADAPRGPFAVGGMSGRISGETPSDGKLTICVSASIMRPTKPLAAVDPELIAPETPVPWQEDLDALLLSMRQNGVEVAEADALLPEAWMEKGYAVVDRSGSFYSAMDGGFYGAGEAPSDSEVPVEETGRIYISFTIDAPEKSAVLGKPEEMYTLSDGSVVRVSRVTLTPLSTTICFTLAQAASRADEVAPGYPIDLHAMWEGLSDERGDALLFTDLWQAGSVAYASAEDRKSVV